MKTSQRFYLACALCLLLIGLLAHSVPATNLCDCMEAQGDAVVVWEFDSCLVCQLQSGVIQASIVPISSDGNLFRVNHLPNLVTLDHVNQISHPPTLS